MREAKFYQASDGSEPVKEWLEKLRKKNKHVEHAKITTRINRAAAGNFAEHRFLAGDLGELKIDYGPGYRVYFGIDGGQIILLLQGGTKQTQQDDIDLAKERWDKYRRDKDKENGEKHGK